MNKNLVRNTIHYRPLLGACLAVAYFCAVPLFALAEGGERNGIYVKALGGLNIVPDEDFDGSGAPFTDGEASFDTGYLAGTAVGYQLNEEFAVELELTYRNNDISGISSGGADFVSGGDLASLAVMANAFYFPDLSETFFPYIGLGFGFMEEIDSDINFAAGGGQRDLEDTAVAWQAMLGAEVPINDSLYLLGEGRYTAAPGPDISNSVGSYDFDYNNFSLNIGLRYLF